MQQSFKMLSRRNGLQGLPSFLIVLVYLLLQTHSCKGQSQVIGPSQPIVAKVGDDIILPCHLESAVDVVSFPLEWTRPDLNPVFVHMRRAGQDLIDTKHPSYVGRTSVSNDELKNGNISLKLSKLKPYDAGRYKCYIPKLKTGASVELVVGAASSPSISLSGLDQKKGGVVLQCESSGWYPEPEVLWLDGEGNLLSAGPTETVRGPDDLYTVSSRVTVEKRHSSSFTCRVQQNHINQTREAQIHVPDDFFEVQSSSSSSTVGLVVSLAVCILVILILGFFVWKLKTKRSHRDETNEGEKKNCNRTKDQVVTGEEPEIQKLLTHETVQMKDVNKLQPAGISPELQEENKRREEEVQRKNQELQEKTDQIGNKDETIRKERQDKEKAQSEVMMLKDHLESKNKEVDGLKAEVNKLTEEKKTSEEERQKWENKFKEEEKKRERAEEEVKKVGGLKDEVNKLTEEKKRSEEERQKLQNKITQLEKHKAADKQSKKTTESDGGSSSSGQQDEKKQNSSSLSQNSTRKPAVDLKVDPHGKYIQLRNTSTEAQQLGGWVLKIQVSDNKPVIHRFGKTFNLMAGKVLTVWCHVYGRNAPPADLVLENLKPWSYTDKPQVSLISHPGEIQYNLYCIN